MGSWVKHVTLLPVVSPLGRRPMRPGALRRRCPLARFCEWVVKSHSEIDPEWPWRGTGCSAMTCNRNSALLHPLAVLSLLLKW